MAIERESLMWRWDGYRLSWLVCLPELRDHYAQAENGGWKPLGTLGGSSTEAIEEVRQEDERRYTPEFRRKSRWHDRRRRDRQPGSTGE